MLSLSLCALCAGVVFRQLALDRVCPPIGDDGWRPRASSVVVAQPRRVAAVSVARRVAAERGRELGGEVGYAVRFDERSSRATRLKYVTDGLLLREALLDGELRRYGVAIVDEAHERTVHTDVLLGVLKRIQRERQQKWDAWQEAQVEGGMVGRGEGNGALSNGALSSPGSEASEEDEDEYVRPPLPPLKLVVMSATLDADAFLDFLGPNAGAVYVAGRSHPVEVLYTSAPEPDVLEAALLATVQIHLDEAPGGVLVFLTGQEEIESAASLLRERAKLLPAAAPPLEVLTLFAAQPPDSQQKVFEPVAEGHRRVVFATNIAETVRAWAFACDDTHTTHARRQHPFHPLLTFFLHPVAHFAWHQVRGGPRSDQGARLQRAHGRRLAGGDARL